MVFYADDDQDDLEFFTEAAELLGKKVFAFSFGEDLIKKLENPPPKPGIIFLDINMPRQSGIEVLKYIRASKYWKMLPVVMISTSSEFETIETCRILGANLYIPKPKSFEGLKKALSYTLTLDMTKTKDDISSFVYKEIK